MNKMKIRDLKISFCKSFKRLFNTHLYLFFFGTLALNSLNFLLVNLNNILQNYLWILDIFTLYLGQDIRLHL